MLIIGSKMSPPPHIGVVGFNLNQNLLDKLNHTYLYDYFHKRIHIHILLFIYLYIFVYFCFNLHTYKYKMLKNEKQEKTTHRTIRPKTG